MLDVATPCAHLDETDEPTKVPHAPPPTDSSLVRASTASPGPPPRRPPNPCLSSSSRTSLLHTSPRREHHSTINRSSLPVDHLPDCRQHDLAKAASDHQLIAAPRPRFHAEAKDGRPSGPASHRTNCSGWRRISGAAGPPPRL